MRKIAANEPDVPAEVKAVVNKFPANNMFYVQNMGVTPLTDKGIENAKGQKLDLPRGLKLNYLKKKGCTAFSTVIYKDNLFGDQVTLQIVKHGKCRQIQQAGFVPIPTEHNNETLQLCSEIANLILETGDYADEHKDGYKISAYKELSGYKVTLTDKNITRNYYILTDADGEFIYMTQSTKESDAEIVEMLQEIGKTDGLVTYQEFYNSFYLQSDHLVGSDQFLGYYLKRLTKQYAKERNNAKWARKMVGHWETSYFFFNPSKGLYTVSLFDMLTGDKRREIYNQLYMKNPDSYGKEKRKVYGAPGIALYKAQFNYYQGFIRYLAEVSFGYGQYIIAASGSYDYSEYDMIARLESMQFEEGGYMAYKERKEKSVDNGNNL